MKVRYFTTTRKRKRRGVEVVDGKMVRGGVEPVGEALGRLLEEYFRSPPEEGHIPAAAFGVCPMATASISTSMGYHNYVDVGIPLPPRSDPPSPTLETLHRVERILRKAAKKGEPPLSYAEIERRLPVKKIRRDTVKKCVNELARFRLVAIGSKGVMWVYTESDQAWNTPTKALR